MGYDARNEAPARSPGRSRSGGEAVAAVPGKRTWHELIAEIGVEATPSPALGHDPPNRRPAQAHEVIQRQETAGYLSPESINAELMRIADHAIRLREQAIPRDTRFLQPLVSEVESLVARCDPAARGAIDPQLAVTQDEIVASFQAVAVFHAARTEARWQTGSAEDQIDQRAEYQRESGWPGAATVSEDWCGMFTNAQLRAAGFADEFNLAFNHVDHVEQFFTYDPNGTNSPTRIRPHGEGPDDGMPLGEYHEQRGSLRSWLPGAEIGEDIRPGDVVTIDWDGDDIADHICIAASYMAPAGDQPGQLITIDGNARMVTTGTHATNHVARRTYEQTSGDGEQPAFSGSAPMRLYGRGRPSAVDFEPGHDYPEFTGRNARDPDGPSGPIQSPGIQRAGDGAVAAAEPSAAFDAASAGAPGELPYRDEMQARLGTDFSSVRAFTGRDLTALGASAATRGEQVVFASSSPDRQTVAHELTHVLQSRQGRVGGAAVSDPGDASEHEARGVASSVTAGERASVGAAPSAAIQRQEDSRVPPPTHPDAPLNGNRQDVALDWTYPADGSYSTNYIIDDNYRLPVSNSTPGSIREVYDFFALRYLRQELPEIAAEYGSIPEESVASLPDGRSARRRAITELNALLQARMQELIVVGDLQDAEDIRRLVFAANQYAIADTLLIPGSTRHAPVTDENATDTWCNVFAFDMVTAMGGYLPRVWWTDVAIETFESGREPGPEEVEQQRANDLYDWMIAWGVPHFGWESVGSPQNAQAEADAGQIVIILASTSTTTPGHVSVVMAQTDNRRAPTAEETGGAFVPLQSQAGRENFASNATGVPAEQVGETGRRAWWEDGVFVGGAGFFVYRANRGNRGFGDLAIRTPEEMGTVLPQAEAPPPMEGDGPH